MTDEIAFRPETDQDREFLFRLYAGTREEEMKLVDWTDEQKEAFLRQQFEAQTAHYRKNYLGAEYWIILRSGAPIGRLYLHQSPGDLRIMDIALVPNHRGSGIGGGLLRDIQQKAAAAGSAVSIHVEQFNPALRLYERLGFRRIGEHGVYYLLEWRRE